MDCSVYLRDDLAHLGDGGIVSAKSLADASMFGLLAEVGLFGLLGIASFLFFSLHCSLGCHQDVVGSDQFNLALLQQFDGFLGEIDLLDELQLLLSGTAFISLHHLLLAVIDLFN